MIRHLVARTLVLLLLAFSPGPTLAQDATPDPEVERLETQVRRLRALQSQYRRDEHGLLARLEEMDQVVRLATTELELAQARQSASLEAVEHLEAQQLALRSQLDQDQASLRRALAAAYERRAPDWLAAILTSRGPGSLEHNLRMIGRLSHRQTETIERCRLRQDELAMTGRALAAEQQRQSNLQRAVLARRTAAQEAGANTRKLLDNLGQRKDDVVAELRDAAARLSRLVSGLGERRTEPLFTEFAKMRGSMPWPVEGTITRRFGLERHPRLNTIIQNQGVEIDAPVGSAVRAVHAGEVAFAKLFKGYGHLIVIDHGGGFHTVYTNLADLAVEVGQRVDHSTVVGHTGGASPLADGGLQFEVRQSSRPLDPEGWLRRRR